MDTEQFEKAIADYEKAFKLDKTKGNIVFDCFSLN